MGLLSLGAQIPDGHLPTEIVSYITAMLNSSSYYIDIGCLEFLGDQQGSSKRMLESRIVLEGLCSWLEG